MIILSPIQYSSPSLNQAASNTLATMPYWAAKRRKLRPLTDAERNSSEFQLKIKIAGIKTAMDKAQQDLRAVNNTYTSLTGRMTNGNLHLYEDEYNACLRRQELLLETLDSLNMQLAQAQSELDNLC